MSALQSVASYFLIPLLYLLVCWFDVRLVLASRGLQNKLRMLLAIFVGVTLALLIIYFDQSTNVLHEALGPAPLTLSLQVAAPCVVLALIAGFAMVLVFDVVFQHERAHAFVVMTTILAIAVSGYFLLSFAAYKELVSLTALAFLSGIGLYFLFRPDSLARLFAAPRVPLGGEAEEGQQDNARNLRW